MRARIVGIDGLRSRPRYGGRLGGLLGLPRFLKVGDRRWFACGWFACGLTMLWRRPAATARSWPARLLRAAARPVRIRFRRRGAVHPGDRLADQLLDRGDRFAVGRSDDGDGGPGQARASGASDAMDVVVRMVRDVEIEHMADRGYVEAARGDVGSNQQRHFALAELVERRRARRLVKVAVQRRRVEAVAQQRLVQLRDLALAIAEHDGVLEVFARPDQVAQRIALVMRFAAGLDQKLGGGRRRWSQASRPRRAPDCAGTAR